AVALYGRVKATRKIAGTGPPAAPPIRLLGAGIGLLCVLALASCARPGQAFLSAERATYDAIAPEYENYVAADERLDAGQKARRARGGAAREGPCGRAAIEPGVGAGRLGIPPALGRRRHRRQDRRRLRPGAGVKPETRRRGDAETGGVAEP